MTVPTLDQVESYDPQHLVSASAHWDETAQRWEDTLSEFNASARGLDFLGRTAESVRASAARQHQGAITDADKLRQAAAIASNAADELRTARQRVLNLVEHAEQAGYSVSSTYQVTDDSGSHSVDSLARAVAGQQMSAAMIAAAGQLWAHDAQTAGRMAKAVDYRTDGGNVIDMHVGDAPDPGKHYCGPLEIAEDTAIGTGGAAGAAGLGGPMGILPGIAALLKSFQDLGHCENPQ